MIRTFQLRLSTDFKQSQNTGEQTVHAARSRVIGIPVSEAIGEMAENLQSLITADTKIRRVQFFDRE